MWARKDLHVTKGLNREILLAELKRDEGVRLKAYKDTVGKLTIGTGRNLDDVGLLASEIARGMTLSSVKRFGVTMAQNDMMLDNDIDRTEADLDRKLPWWRTLDEVRQRVLVNMAFNLGITGLLGFKNTLALIKAGKFIQASENMLKSKWATQVGQRAIRLATLMELGVRKV